MAVLYQCTRCNKKVSFKGIRYRNSGKELICTECYTTTIKKQLVVEKPLEVQKTMTGKVVKEKYICMKCNYNFTYKPSEAALRCPLCGHAEVLKDDYNAEKLLNEAIGRD